MVIGMTNFDKANLLCMFDECLTKIIDSLDPEHPEEFCPGRALGIAQKAQRGFRKALGQELDEARLVRDI